MIVSCRASFIAFFGANFHVLSNMKILTTLVPWGRLSAWVHAIETLFDTFLTSFVIFMVLLPGISPNATLWHTQQSRSFLRVGWHWGVSRDKWRTRFRNLERWGKMGQKEGQQDNVYIPSGFLLCHVSAPFLLSGSWWEEPPCQDWLLKWAKIKNLKCGNTLKQCSKPRSYSLRAFW